MRNSINIKFRARENCFFFCCSCSGCRMVLRESNNSANGTANEECYQRFCFDFGVLFVSPHSYVIVLKNNNNNLFQLNGQMRTFHLSQTHPCKYQTSNRIRLLRSIINLFFSISETKLQTMAMLWAATWAIRFSSVLVPSIVNNFC